MMPLTERWSGFWFGPRDPTDLAVGRILFFTGILLLYLRLDTSDWAHVSPIFWTPVGFFRWTGLRPLSAEALAVLDLLWKLCLLSAAVGFKTRVSMTGAFLLGTYLLGLPHNFGKIHHGTGLLVLVLGILALSRGGDALSVDRLITRRRDPTRGGTTPRGEYTWPIRLIQLTIAFAFFASGLAKLRVSGWSWVASDNLANLLVLHHYTQRPPLTDFGLVLAQKPLIARGLAFGALCLELAAPLAVFSRRARWFVVPGLLGMMAGFLFFFGFTPWPFVIVSVFWIPWQKVAETCGLAAPRDPPAIDPSRRS